MFLRLFNHAAPARPAREPETATLTFSARTDLIGSQTRAESDVNPGDCPMPFVSRLSVLTVYVVFAFVGAIVLGVF